MNSNEKKLKGVSWSVNTILEVEALCATTGRKKQFSAITEDLVLGNLNTILLKIDAGLLRRLANALALLDNGHSDKARAEIEKIYKHVADATKR